MDWQYTPYVIPMIAAAALAVAIVFFASRRRGARGATTYLERLFGQRTSQLQKINAQLREEIEERKRHEAALREKRGECQGRREKRTSGAEQNRTTERHVVKHQGPGGVRARFRQ